LWSLKADNIYYERFDFTIWILCASYDDTVVVIGARRRNGVNRHGEEFTAEYRIADVFARDMDAGAVRRQVVPGVPPPKT